MKNVYQLISDLRDEIYKLSNSDAIKAITFLEKYLEDTKRYAQNQMYGECLEELINAMEDNNQ